MPLPRASVVIFDEAHLATADTRLGILERYAEAVRIGFTATPARKSGKSLGTAFECLLPGLSVRALTAAGVLVPTRIFNTPVLTEKELRAIPKDNDNDYQAGALGTVLSRPKLIGDICSNWLRIANGKRTLLFCVNKTHGAALLAEFQRAGIAAEMLTDEDDEATREQVISRLESGQTRVVINCFVLSVGTDIPAVECIVLARPTRSLTMYLQMVGRGLRPSPGTGKTACILIDHGHVVENLGLPASDFEWTLEAGRNVNTEAMARARTITPEAMRTCKECSAIWMTSEQGHACPCCGWKPAPKAKPITVQQANLEEMADTEQLRATHPKVIRFYQECLGWNQKYKPHKWLENANKCRAACWHATRENFKLPKQNIPSLYWDLAAIPASVEVQGYMKSRDQNYARRQSYARQRERAAYAGG